MTKTSFLTVSKRIFGAVLGGTLFVINESVFILSIHRLGVLISILLFGSLYSVISLWLFTWFQREADSRSILGRFARLSTAKATSFRANHARLIATSQILAVSLSAVFASAFVTTMFIGLLGYRGMRAKTYVILQTFFTVAVWAIFFAGGLRLVFGK